MDKTKNIKSIKLFLVILIIVLSVIDTFQIVQYATFVPIDATIVDITKSDAASFDKTDTKHAKIITYQYFCNGIEYQTEMRVFSIKGKSIGDKSIIKINQNEPTKVFSSFSLVIINIMLVFFIVFSFAVTPKKNKDIQNKFVCKRGEINDKT